MATQIQQVVLSLKQDPLEPALKESSLRLVGAIEVLSVNAVKLSHPLGEVRLGSFHNQMIVIVQKDIAMQQPVEAMYHQTERIDKDLSIGVVLKSRTLSRCSVGHMIQRAGKLDTNWSRHTESAHV